MAPSASPIQIRLVPVGTVSSAIVEFLALTLPSSLGIPCWISNGRLDVSRSYSTIRQQYNSTEILATLVKLNSDDHSKILGVTDVDLFIPILTFVFGEAQLNGPAALVSVHRLRQPFYGLPDDDGLFFERCEKEALHELGHAFGLVHCPDYECVMHFSNSIEQVDIKSNSYCPRCRQSLSQVARSTTEPPT